MSNVTVRPNYQANRAVLHAIRCWDRRQVQWRGFLNVVPGGAPVGAVSHRSARATLLPRQAARIFR